MNGKLDINGMGRAARGGLIAAVAVVVVGLGATFASAAAPAITFVPPSPTEGATLTSNAVEFAFTYNRIPNATVSLVCALAGPTSSSGACDSPTALGDKGSQSGESYGGLGNGSYTFTVSLALEDGGTASATLDFTVDAGHVYWANSGTSAFTGSIGRANLDGTGVNQSFVTAFRPNGVAVDGDHVYWANTGALHTIGRANLDGTDVNQSFITTASAPVGVAVDAGHVYWANFGVFPFGTGSIGRANLDGTGVNQSFIPVSFLSHPAGVAVDAGHVYWANFFPTGTIGRANLDGTGVNQSFISGAFIANGVAVDAGHVYWSMSSSGAGTIGRANLDGTGVNQSFITGTPGSEGVAVDPGHIYWANAGSGTIGRADLDGSNVNQSFITGASSPAGVAVG